MSAIQLPSLIHHECSLVEHVQVKSKLFVQDGLQKGINILSWYRKPGKKIKENSTGVSGHPEPFAYPFFSKDILKSGQL